MWEDRSGAGGAGLLSVPPSIHFFFAFWNGLATQHFVIASEFSSSLFCELPSTRSLFVVCAGDQRLVMYVYDA